MRNEPRPVDPKKATPEGGDKCATDQKHKGGATQKDHSGASNAGSPPAASPPAHPTPQPGKPGHSGRPGSNVQTDHRGKTHEGETGVSGETADNAGSNRAAPVNRSPRQPASTEGASTVAHDHRPNETQSKSKAPAAKPAPLPDPRAVLHDPTLSRDEKIEKLRRWGQDAREVETANDEGMRGGATPSNLPAVQAALRELGVSETQETDAGSSAGS